MTQLRHLRYDAASAAEMLPAWSPDSRQIAFMLEKGGRRQIAFAPADGSGPVRLAGPDTSSQNGMGHAWSPDGRTLVITILPRSGEETHWSFDLASGETTELEAPVQTWQRVAP
jgi:Tol biopolymer transport system component